MDAGRVGLLMSGFAELMTQSHYSFLSAASSPQALMEKAAAYGYHALALTDECSVAGVVKAWQANRDFPGDNDTVEKPVKLITGSVFNADQGQFVVLVCNQRGYTQLSALITRCRQRSEKGCYQFNVDDLLTADLNDCIVLWWPGVHIRTVPEPLADVACVFSQRFCILAVAQCSSQDRELLRRVRAFSAQLHADVVASSAALMATAAELPLLHTMHAIAAGRTVTEHEAELALNAERRLRTVDELESLFPADWLANSVKVAERCNFDLGTLKYSYPGEVVPAGFTAPDYLTDQAWQGAYRRYSQGVPDAVSEQLERELALVRELEYEHFFLTIYDLVMFAQSRGILFQGRGSAANSVLCYCLHITAVEPAQSKLLFERFLSRERREPPDIDVDFEHQRREEVIQYIYRKYGRHRAALTATVITYRLRSAVRDVGKALGFPQALLGQLLSRLDRRDNKEDWQQQLIAFGVLNHPMGAHLFTLVDALRGSPRHLSQHVGGFVIAAERLSDLVPVENAAMPERTVIQWDKNDIEALGLLKVDVLGLGMLSALRRGFDWVRHCYQRDLSVATIPQEDPNVYTMLQKADAVGIFQVESRAQMNMLPRLKPATFYDLVVQIAIVRPGPIQGDMVHPYLRRRDGLEPVEYPNEAVKDVLERTLGIPIFQEQVIKLAMVAAGFTGGEADQLRRAMGTWKSKGQMMEFRRKIVEGMLQRGYEESFAVRLFEQICGFGEYGFPESHAASFAILAYASAWLKHHYPGPFYLGILNSMPMGFYSASQLIQDAQRHGVTVLPVCVNHSLWEHSLEPYKGDYAIRLGLCKVKGLATEDGQLLVTSRPCGGYGTVAEIEALQLAGTSMQALASADTFAMLAGHRYQARWRLTHLGEQLPLLQVAEQAQAEYTLTAPTATDNMVEDYTATGLSLRPHPLALLNQQGKLPAYKRAADLHKLRSGQLVTVIGLVVGRQRPGTSSGVTFITLEDETGNVNVVLWRERGRQQRREWLNARLLQVKGVIEIKGSIVHVIAGRLHNLTDTLPVSTIKSRDFQ